MELVLVGVKRQPVACYRKFDFQPFVTTNEMVGEYSNHLELNENSITYTLWYGESSREWIHYKFIVDIAGNGHGFTTVR